MIQGWENETAPLSDDEKKLLPIIAKGLSNKRGKENAITSTAIILKMKSAGYKIDPPRLRKMIHHIRMKHLVMNLISSSKGYYIAVDQADLIRYIQSLQDRMTAIERIANSFDAPDSSPPEYEQKPEPPIEPIEQKKEPKEPIPKRKAKKKAAEAQGNLDFSTDQD